MLTPLPNPVIDCWRFRLDLNPAATRAFTKEFMDSPEAVAFQQNSDGAPGVFVYDPRQPLDGLQAFGYEGAEALKALYVKSSTSSVDRPASTASEPEQAASDSPSNSPTIEPFEEGDLIIVQARPRSRLSGGSTSLGRLRTAIHRAAISKGLFHQDKKECHFLWVTDFPLFTPNNETDPGQGGSAGFSATHHPFTAPKTAEDVDLLITNPLEAIADHYDLVVNGVELGGGSRRIHNSEMQQFVMREVLKVNLVHNLKGDSMLMELVDERRTDEGFLSSI
jgi:aspartyl-tRNA synthetase